MTFSLQDTCDLSDLPICIRTWCIRHFAKREESYHPHAPSKNRPRYSKYTHKISWLSFCFFPHRRVLTAMTRRLRKRLVPPFSFSFTALTSSPGTKWGVLTVLFQRLLTRFQKKKKKKKKVIFFYFPVNICSKFKFRLNRCLKSNRHLKSKQNRYGLAPFQTYLFQWMKWRIIPRLGQHNQRNGELSGCWALATAVHYI